MIYLFPWNFYSTIAFALYCKHGSSIALRLVRMFLGKWEFMFRFREFVCQKQLQQQQSLRCSFGLNTHHLLRNHSCPQEQQKISLRECTSRDRNLVLGLVLLTRWRPPSKAGLLTANSSAHAEVGTLRRPLSSLMLVSIEAERQRVYLWFLRSSIRPFCLCYSFLFFLIFVDNSNVVWGQETTSWTSLHRGLDMFHTYARGKGSPFCGCIAFTAGLRAGKSLAKKCKGRYTGPLMATTAVLVLSTVTVCKVQIDQCYTNTGWGLEKTVGVVHKFCCFF